MLQVKEKPQSNSEQAKPQQATPEQAAAQAHEKCETSWNRVNAYRAHIKRGIGFETTATQGALKRLKRLEEFSTPTRLILDYVEPKQVITLFPPSVKTPKYRQFSKLLDETKEEANKGIKKIRTLVANAKELGNTQREARPFAALGVKLESLAKATKPGSEQDRLYELAKTCFAQSEALLSGAIPKDVPNQIFEDYQKGITLPKLPKEK